MDGSIITHLILSTVMEIKDILTPKNMLITLGSIVIVMSLWGMTHGDEWAEIGWGEGNVLAHDEAYEEMWALHLMPLGVMAIVTALFDWKGVSQGCNVCSFGSGKYARWNADFDQQ